MTSEDLLTEARRLVEHPDAGTAGVWPRAAALLARQALEQAMAGLWAGQPGADWPVRRDDAVAAAVPDRVRGPGRGDAGRLPVGRAKPRLPLPPVRTGPHRKRANRWLSETADLVAFLRSRAGTIATSSPS